MLAQTEDEFVDVGLVEVGVELRGREGGRAARRQHLGLQDTVTVAVIQVTEGGGAGSAEICDAVATHDLLVNSHRGPAEHRLAIGSDHVGEAESRADLEAVLPDHVEDAILPSNLVEADAQVDGQPGGGSPGVLKVDPMVRVVSLAGVDGGGRGIAAVERNETRGRVARILHPLLFQEESAVDVLGLEVVTVPGGCEETGLELVRAAPTVLEVREIAAQDDLGRGLQAQRLGVAALEDAPRALDRQRLHVGALVNDDLRPGSWHLVDRALVRTALVVVGRQEC